MDLEVADLGDDGVGSKGRGLECNDRREGDSCSKFVVSRHEITLLKFPPASARANPAGKSLHHQNVAFVYRPIPLTSIDPPLICHATLRPEQFPAVSGQSADFFGTAIAETAGCKFRKGQSYGQLWWNCPKVVWLVQRAARARLQRRMSRRSTRSKTICASCPTKQLAAKTVEFRQQLAERQDARRSAGSGLRRRPRGIAPRARHAPLRRAADRRHDPAFAMPSPK